MGGRAGEGGRCGEGGVSGGGWGVLLAGELEMLVPRGRDQWYEGRKPTLTRQGVFTQHERSSTHEEQARTQVTASQRFGVRTRPWITRGMSASRAPPRCIQRAQTVLTTTPLRANK